MQKKLIHTPEGVRDIYGNEFRKKLETQNRLMEVLRSFGYEDIQTPVFEFFDIFSGNIGTTPSKELYKFFDKEGD
nr:ATP phosphoribosyltransferase regulatory subunit [Lachnospiraceae bacterium]